MGTHSLRLPPVLPRGLNCNRAMAVRPCKEELPVSRVCNSDWTTIASRLSNVWENGEPEQAPPHAVRVRDAPALVVPTVDVQKGLPVSDAEKVVVRVSDVLTVGVHKWDAPMLVNPCVNGVVKVLKNCETVWILPVSRPGNDWIIAVACRIGVPMETAHVATAPAWVNGRQVPASRIA